MLSTLLIAVVVWLAGVACAERFGHVVDTVSSLALIAFGGWFAISAWRDLRTHGGQGNGIGSGRRFFKLRTRRLGHKKEPVYEVVGQSEGF